MTVCVLWHIVVFFCHTNTAYGFCFASIFFSHNHANLKLAEEQKKKKKIIIIRIIIIIKGKSPSEVNKMQSDFQLVPIVLK